MRSMLLAGFVALTAIAAIAPAHAQTTGGISITHGGGNVNVATGKFSEADQSATTLGGIAGRHGVAITNGGNNRNVASGTFSFAGQNTTTVGGTALGRGRVITNGGGNLNLARASAAPRRNPPRRWAGRLSVAAPRSPTAASTPTWRPASSLRRISRSSPSAARRVAMA